MCGLHCPFLLTSGCVFQLFLNPLATYCVTFNWGFLLEEGNSLAIVGFAPEVYTDFLILSSLLGVPAISTLPHAFPKWATCFKSGCVFWRAVSSLSQRFCSSMAVGWIKKAECQCYNKGGMRLSDLQDHLLWCLMKIESTEIERLAGKTLIKRSGKDEKRSSEMRGDFCHSKWDWKSGYLLSSSSAKYHLNIIKMFFTPPLHSYFFAAWRPLCQTSCSGG